MAVSIDNLPPEVLEQVFKKITSLRDVGSCSQTCKKWKQIMNMIFKKKGNFIQFLKNHSGKFSSPPPS